MGKLKPINPTKAQIVANPQAAAHDYDNLTHKPQINSHTLSGNKSSDDLGLQKKLTAGENITINANGEISATGGVTSYTELTDKPQIEGHELSGNKTAIELGLQKTITEGDDYIDLPSSGVLKLQKELVLHSERFTKSGRESLNLFPMNSIMYIPNPSTSLSNTPADITGAPALIVTLAAKDNYYGYHIEQEYIDTGLHGSKKYIRVGYYNYASTEVRHFYDWVEISANTTITSAAVNQNGTITFTMSDDSTVTTTGESVIGPQGDDYVLTPQDKTDIANIVLSELPTTQGVQYGNTSN